ncbi:AAA family ATPase [Infirmifilum sp. SLHALR2]|nr:MAG: ATPase [Thermofilum sp. NZ13]
MLFDPRPKSTRSELFDRDAELSELHRLIDEERPLVALTGVRRIGKTSVLRVLLSEVNIPFILMDARGLPANYGLRDLYALLSSGMSNKGFIESMRSILESIRGLRIMGFEVELAWKGRSALPLPVLLDYLNKRRVIIAVDEAQCLRGPRGGVFLEALAHAYDYDDNITFILTGSEVGLLFEYLGVDDPSSPLYGRRVDTITLGRFSRDDSAEFLRQGFREAGVEVPSHYIEAIVGFFDGIPGWLALAGSTVVSARGRIGLEELRRQAVEVAKRELMEIVEARGRRYALVLKLIAQGVKRWSELKSRLEEAEGRIVPSSVLHNILESLRKLSIVEDYEFLDPVYKEAARTL